MDLERWRRIDALLLAALEREPAERHAFLEEACSGDEALSAEVKSLLSAGEGALSIIDTSAFEVAAGLLSEHVPELVEGQLIGRYRVLSFLGAGGMGEVYLARDEKLSRSIALKLLPSYYTQNRDRLRRFEQEARAASALNHPNILTIHEIEQIDGRQFIATEFVEGENLRQRLRRGELGLTETLEIAVQIAGALSAAHKAGIVHCDIKPENIMLRPDGYAKVLDFGLARLAEQQEPSIPGPDADGVNIPSGLLMGTVKYMSPEQARGLPVDPRSDIFSFGVVLYEMATGRAPFEGEDARRLVRSILEDAPRPLPDCAPEALQRIVSKMLSKGKAERYQTAEDLLADFKVLRRQAEFTTDSESVIRKFHGNTAPGRGGGARKASTVGYFAIRIGEHKQVAAVVFLSLCILLAGVSYPLWRRITKRTAPSDFNVAMLTTTGEVVDAAISADGRHVAYVTEDGSLRIRDAAANQDIQLLPPGDHPIAFVVFSPDGKYLYYCGRADYVPPDVPSWSRRQLYRIPLSGGVAEGIGGYVSGRVTISPDGKQIAFIRSDISTRMHTLFIADADGTEERPIITRKAPNIFPTNFGEGPSWSPDGKRLAYVAMDASDGYRRVFELSLETNQERPLTSEKWDYVITDVTWLADSGGILFIAGNSSISNAIWYLSYPGLDLRRVTNDSNKYTALSVATDPNRLVAVQTTDFVDLWIAPDADAGRARRVKPGRHDGYYGFAWTPDRRIVYTSETGGNFDIWIANEDGTNQKQLTANARQNSWPTVTGDGRYIIFQSNRTGADHIWRMDIDGGNQQQLTSGTVERWPSCSPGSKWVVYTAWESGRPTAWKVSVEGGAPREVNGAGCFAPKVSHDGRLIACSSGKQVLIFSSEGGQPVAAVELPLDGSSGGWTPDDRGLLYLNLLDGVANYWIKPIDGGAPKQLTFFKPDQRTSPGRTFPGRSANIALVAWSPDGTDLLYTRYDRKSDLVMMSGLE